MRVQPIHRRKKKRGGGFLEGGVRGCSPFDVPYPLNNASFNEELDSLRGGQAGDEGVGEGFGEGGMYAAVHLVAAMLKDPPVDVLGSVVAVAVVVRLFVKGVGALGQGKQRNVVRRSRYIRSLWRKV